MYCCRNVLGVVSDKLKHAAVHPVSELYCKGSVGAYGQGSR